MNLSRLWANGGLILWYATLLHLTWGVAILFEPVTSRTTAFDTLWYVAGIISPELLGGILILASTLAIVGMELEPRRHPGIAFYFGLQQLLVLISGFDAGGAVLAGHFADGVERSRLFILKDQAPAFIAAALHTVALFQKFAPGFWSVET